MREPGERIGVRYKKNYARASLTENLAFIERYSFAEIDTLLANGSKTKSIVIIIDFCPDFNSEARVTRPKN